MAWRKANTASTFVAVMLVLSSWLFVLFISLSPSELYWLTVYVQLARVRVSNRVFYCVSYLLSKASHFRQGHLHSWWLTALVCLSLSVQLEIVVSVLCFIR